MSMLDASLVMSDAQSVTTSAASTDYIDLGAAGSVLKDAWLIIRVDTLQNTGTMTLSLETDSDTGFATAKVTLWASAAIDYTTLVAGYVIRVPLPAGLKRYLRVYYTASTTITSKWDAYIVQTPLIAS